MNNERAELIEREYQEALNVAIPPMDTAAMHRWWFYHGVKAALLAADAKPVQQDRAELIRKMGLLAVALRHDSRIDGEWPEWEEAVEQAAALLAADASKLAEEYTRGRSDGWEAAMAKVAADAQAGGEWRCAAPPCKCNESNYGRCAYANYPQPQAVPHGSDDAGATFVLSALIAAGHVSQEKAEQAWHIWSTLPFKPVDAMLAASPAAPQTPGAPVEKI